MIKANKVAEIKEQTGKTSLQFEINFGEKYKDCIKITGDGIVKYSDLFEFMFILGRPEQQARIIPVQQELGNEYMKQIRIKCKKDMKEGEELVVNVRVHVPSVVESQILKDLKSPYVDKLNEKGL